MAACRPGGRLPRRLRRLAREIWIALGWPDPGRHGATDNSAWLASPMGFEQQVDQWREFHPAGAGAAAVLLGLVFVALSLHLEKAEAAIPVLGLSVVAA